LSGPRSKPIPSTFPPRRSKSSKVSATTSPIWSRNSRSSSLFFRNRRSRSRPYRPSSPPLPPTTSPAPRTASTPAASSSPPPTSPSARSLTTRRPPTTKASPDITCSYPCSSNSPGCPSSASTASASTRTSKAGPCTRSNSAKRSASTRIPSPITAVSPLSSSAPYDWSSTPESIRKDGAASKSWTSCASPARLMSPPSSPRPTATSRGPHRPSVINSASSRSASFAHALRKNWAPSLTSAPSTTRCSTAEPSRSIFWMPAPTSGSHNRNQSDGYAKTAAQPKGTIAEVRGQRSDCRSKNCRVGFSNLQSDFSPLTLLHADLRNLQLGIGVIPLRRDVLKGQPERFALAGRERRQVEVHGFIVRSAGAQNADGKFLALRRLAHVVLERDLRHRVDDGLIAGVGDGAIEIADGGADKILRGTCFQL